jgi:hypothetical protein
MVSQASMLKSKNMNEKTLVEWILQTLSNLIRDEKKTESVLLSPNTATPRSWAFFGAVDVTLNIQRFYVCF